MLILVAQAAIDTAMVGQLGPTPQAAVSAAMAWTQGFMIFVLGLTRAIDPVVAQAHGAGDKAAAGQALARMLAAALPMSLLVAAWDLCTGWGCALLGQLPESIPLAADFAVGLAIGAPGFVLQFVLRSFLSDVGVTRPAMVSAVAVLVVKVGLNFLLIPAMGVAGVGLASGIAFYVNFAVLAWLARDTLREYWPAKVKLAGTWRLVRSGIPLGLEMGSEVWGFAMLSMMMGWLGTLALASHAVAITLASASFMVPLGISFAAAARVGHRLGAGEPWTPAAGAALGLGSALQLAMSALFLFGAPLLVAPFSPDPAVRETGAALVRIAAAFQLFDGIQVIAFGVLRGAGDTRLPVVANLVGYYLVGLPLAYFLAFRGGMGAVGAWIGIAAGLATVAACLLWRVRWTAQRGGSRVVA
jgi:MATE family multidrug resistance protein